MSVLDRFLAKVGPSDDGCAPWQGAKNNHGYGQLYVAGKRVLAHRLAYEMFVEPIPDDRVIDHVCQNPACVNPHHLDVVTQQENMQRSIERRTHCRAGHEFTPETTRYTVAGYRRCRLCDRIHLRRASARRRQANNQQKEEQ